MSNTVALLVGILLGWFVMPMALGFVGLGAKA